VAVLSSPKRVIFGRFVGVKIYICVISYNLSLGDGRQIPIGMLNSAWIEVGDKPKMCLISFKTIGEVWKNLFENNVNGYVQLGCV
jgi:hypothetical protein